MLSKEEIEEAYWRGYTERDKKAQQICKECKYRKKLKQLETKEHKIIEKLEEDIVNNNFKETQCLEDKGRYFFAKEILKTLKGEKE